MPGSRAEFLIEQLLANRLTGAEFDEFLAGLGNDTRLAEYTQYLEQYFMGLVRQDEEEKRLGLTSWKRSNGSE
ncbi:hypothetical protein GCM10023189_55500 [Nibrella saemangeumensis]|uniref:Rap-GAP domain-containing protein n=1 Tax=Nibrella saemangeumensis TaxID=1084526 RepID=A0ABP8NP92_9BACT